MIAFGVADDQKALVSHLDRRAYLIECEGIDRRNEIVVLRRGV
jgi:hypothetical protein